MQIFFLFVHEFNKLNELFFSRMLVRQDELDKDPTVRSRGGRGDIAGSTGKGRLSGGLPDGCQVDVGWHPT